MANNQINNEYVRKGYLKAYLANRGVKTVNYDEWEHLCDCIDDAKPADVRENVRGEWIYHETENDRYDDIKCPFCKKTYTVDAYRIDDIGFTATDFNFCPNCGADMRERRTDEIH